MTLTSLVADNDNIKTLWFGIIFGNANPFTTLTFLRPLTETGVENRNSFVTLMINRARSVVMQIVFL